VVDLGFETVVVGVAVLEGVGRATTLRPEGGTATRPDVGGGAGACDVIWISCVCEREEAPERMHRMRDTLFFIRHAQKWIAAMCLVLKIVLISYGDILDPILPFWDSAGPFEIASPIFIL
jgi:hypothetical protein